MILLVSDIGELKANPKRSASGTVLEAKLDKGRGPVATVLVQDGTLHVGDTFIAGPIVGKVRALIDDRGRHVKVGRPVHAGRGARPGRRCRSRATRSRRSTTRPRRGRSPRSARRRPRRQALGAKGGRLTLESLQQQIAEGGVKELPIIIKADVQGSAEVLADTLPKLSDDKVKIRIIHAGVGAINESDVLLASASNAIIIGFNVRPDRNAAEVAEREKVDIRQHSVIYNVTDEMKKAMTGPARADVQGGAARHRRRCARCSRCPKFGTIAGCMVTDGPHHPQRRRAGPAAARQRRRLRRQDRLAAPLQGRRQRGQVRLRVRHRPRAVQRHQGRRRHRGVRHGAGRGQPPNTVLGAQGLGAQGARRAQGARGVSELGGVAPRAP